jgi:S-(hydroxymethyl)glutathione dehydrogenase/alcohol dehydrogenase
VQTQAALLAGIGERFEVSELQLDDPREGEVLVRIAASGLCGSDLAALEGKRRLAPFPVVLGHEAAGVVEATGDGVEHLRPGDHVVLSILAHCGRCASCRGGLPNHCSTAAAAMSAGGLLDRTSRLKRAGQRVNHFLCVSSFAQHAVVPASAVTVIDRAMPLDRAALIGCAVLTGYGAVNNTARVRRGDRVAVFGCGGVGLTVVQAARIAGAAEVIAVDVHPGKLELARTVGATQAIDARAPGVSRALRDASQGGVDHAFEAVGRQETIEQAWASLATGGQLVVIGTLATGARVSLDAAPLIEDKRLCGCYLGRASVARDVPAVVSLYLDGQLLLDEMITRRIGLDELDEGFARLRQGAEARQLVIPHGEHRGPP